MFYRVLTVLALVAGVTLAGTAMGEDRLTNLRYVDKPGNAAKGEKLRTESYDRNNNLVGITIHYSNGYVRNESYSNGKLKSAHETNFKGWGRDIEYNDDEKPSKETVTQADGSKKSVTYESDGVKPASTISYDKDNNPLEEEHFKNFKLTSSRKWRADKGLDIIAYRANGKTPRFKQSWRHEPTGQGKIGRETPYLLDYVVEFDAAGMQVRKLEFHGDGKSLSKVTRTKDDGSSTVTAIDTKGFVESIEQIAPNGQRTAVAVKPGTALHKEPDYSQLILDPAHGSDEPGKVKK